MVIFYFMGMNRNQAERLEGISPKNLKSQRLQSLKWVVVAYNQFWGLFVFVRNKKLSKCIF